MSSKGGAYVLGDPLPDKTRTIPLNVRRILAYPDGYRAMNLQKWQERPMPAGVKDPEAEDRKRLEELLASENVGLQSAIDRENAATKNLRALIQHNAELRQRAGVRARPLNADVRNNPPQPDVSGRVAEAPPSAVQAAPLQPPGQQQPGNTGVSAPVAPPPPVSSGTTGTAEQPHQQVVLGSDGGVEGDPGTAAAAQQQAEEVKDADPHTQKQLESLGMGPSSDQTGVKPTGGKPGEPGKLVETGDRPDEEDDGEPKDKDDLLSQTREQFIRTLYDVYQNCTELDDRLPKLTLEEFQKRLPPQATPLTMRYVNEDENTRLVMLFNYMVSGLIPTSDTVTHAILSSINPRNRQEQEWVAQHQDFLRDRYEPIYGDQARQADDREWIDAGDLFQEPPGDAELFLDETQRDEYAEQPSDDELFLPEGFEQGYESEGPLPPPDHEYTNPFYDTPFEGDPLNIFGDPKDPQSLRHEFPSLLLPGNEINKKLNTKTCNGIILKILNRLLEVNEDDPFIEREFGPILEQEINEYCRRHDTHPSNFKRINPRELGLTIMQMVEEISVFQKRKLIETLYEIARHGRPLTPFTIYSIIRDWLREAGNTSLVTRNSPYMSGYGYPPSLKRGRYSTF